MWIEVNIKSKDSDPHSCHPVGPVHTEQGTRRNSAQLPATFPLASPQLLFYLLLSFSLSVLQGKLKQMRFCFFLFFFFPHSQATFILTNIYQNQYILIETNGS